MDIIEGSILFGRFISIKRDCINSFKSLSYSKMLSVCVGGLVVVKIEIISYSVSC